MNKRDLFSVALKFISMLLFLNCLGSITQFVLELTLPVSKQLSLFSFSPKGSIIRFIEIVIYIVLGYILFTKSDNISKKVIRNQSLGTVSKETVVQIAVAYQAVAGMTLAFVNIIFNIIHYLPYYMPMLMVKEFSSFISQILGRIGLYILIFCISALMLRYYEQITRFLLKFIPNKFWGK